MYEACVRDIIYIMKWLDSWYMKVYEYIEMKYWREVCNSNLEMTIYSLLIKYEEYD